MPAFHPTPPVVLPAGRGGKLEVDLLPRVLTDVPDPQVSGLPVEGVAPGVPQAVRPDLRPDPWPAGERIVGRDGVRTSAGPSWIDAEHLAQQGVQPLPGVQRIAL